MKTTIIGIVTIISIIIVVFTKSWCSSATSVVYKEVNPEALLKK